MTLGGTLDFQGQNAQSLRFLTSATINTNAVQNVDLTNAIGPMDQGLVLAWVATAGFSGLPLAISAQANLPTIFFAPECRVADGTTIVLPFIGGLVSAGGVGGITINAKPPSDVGGTATGTLFVFALTAPPTIIPSIRRPFIGQGLTNGSVNVGAGATTAVLAAPPDGQHYRLKALSVFVLAAPAAVQRVSWVRTDSAQVMISQPFLAAAGQVWNIPLDLQWDFGLSLTNNTSVTVTTGVLYELWSN